MIEYDRKGDQIAYSQAMNLAVSYVAIVKDQFKTPKKRQEAVLAMREWFYEELCKVPPRTQQVDAGQEIPVRPKRTYKSEKQELFLRSQDEVAGAYETPATVDAVFGNGEGPRGSGFEG